MATSTKVPHPGIRDRPVDPDRLLSSLAAAPGATPFVGPNQATLEQMLKAMTAQPPQP